MPAISFSTLKDKLLNGEKKQTIRPYSTFWMKWIKGNRLVGYWKMRTKQCEKLFDSYFSEDPFVVKWKDFTDELMQRDGFTSLKQADELWFVPHYGQKKDVTAFGPVFLWEKEFVVIRWF